MKRLYAIPLVFLLAACSALPSFMRPPTPTEDPFLGCASPQPSEKDIQSALNFHSDVFPASDWSQTHEMYDYNVAVTYTHRTLPAFAVVDLLLFCDEKGTDQVAELYFKDTDVLAMYAADFGELKIDSQCGTDDLFLYEITADGPERDFNSSAWGKIQDKVRFFIVRLVVQNTFTDQFNEYSSMLFPELSSCEQ
ncbi:MAG: hypothetical protein JNM55_20390 [Anaerolineales bacterium]|nr:hypothetical protein [Anaerolineales bacterium]